MYKEAGWGCKNEVAKVMCEAGWLKLTSSTIGAASG
jgi:hypothetical protein